MQPVMGILVQQGLQGWSSVGETPEVILPLTGCQELWPKLGFLHHSLWSWKSIWTLVLSQSSFWYMHWQELGLPMWSVSATYRGEKEPLIKKELENALCSPRGSQESVPVQQSDKGVGSADFLTAFICMTARHDLSLYISIQWWNGLKASSVSCLLYVCLVSGFVLIIFIGLPKANLRYLHINLLQCCFFHILSSRSSYFILDCGRT